MEYLEEYLEEQIFRGITRKAKNVKRSNIYRYFEYLGENGLRVIDIGIKQAQSFQG